MILNILIDQSEYGKAVSISRNSSFVWFKTVLVQSPALNAVPLNQLSIYVFFFFKFWLVLQLLTNGQCIIFHTLPSVYCNEDECIGHPVLSYVHSAFPGAIQERRFNRFFRTFLPARVEEGTLKFPEATLLPKFHLGTSVQGDWSRQQGNMVAVLALDTSEKRVLLQVLEVLYQLTEWD